MWPGQSSSGDPPRTHLFATFLNHESLPDYRGLYFQPLVSSSCLLQTSFCPLGLSMTFTLVYLCLDDIPTTTLALHCHTVGKGSPLSQALVSHSRRETRGRGVGPIPQKEREVSGGLATRTSDTGCSLRLHLGPSEYGMRLWHVG